MVQPAILGAKIFFFGRLAYLFTYLFAVLHVRSPVWTLAFAGIVVMAWLEIELCLPLDDDGDRFLRG